MLNETERAIMADFLDQLSDTMGSAECNYLKLPDTPEGWALAKEVADEIQDGDEPPRLVTDDWIVLGVLRKKMGL